MVATDYLAAAFDWFIKSSKLILGSSYLILFLLLTEAKSLWSDFIDSNIENPTSLGSFLSCETFEPFFEANCSKVLDGFFSMFALFLLDTDLFSSTSWPDLTDPNIEKLTYATP